MPRHSERRWVGGKEERQPQELLFASAARSRVLRAISAVAEANSDLIRAQKETADRARFRSIDDAKRKLADATELLAATSDILRSLR